MDLPLHAGAAGRAILSEVGVDVPSAPAPPLQRPHCRRPGTTRAGRPCRPRGRLRISVGQHIPLAAGVAAPLRIGPDLVAARVHHPAPPQHHRLPTSIASDPSSAKPPTPLADAARHRTATEKPAQPSTADATALGRMQRLLEILVAEPPAPRPEAELARRLAANDATAARLRTTADSIRDSAIPAAERRIAAGPLLLKLGGHTRIRMEHRRSRRRGDARPRPLPAGKRSASPSSTPRPPPPPWSPKPAAPSPSGTASASDRRSRSTPAPPAKPSSPTARRTSYKASRSNPSHPAHRRTMDHLERDLQQIRDSRLGPCRRRAHPRRIRARGAVLRRRSRCRVAHIHHPPLPSRQHDVPALTAMLTDAARQITALLSI